MYGARAKCIGLVILFSQQEQNRSNDRHFRAFPIRVGRKDQTATQTAGLNGVTYWRVQIPPETRYARSGDLSLAYQVFGEGPALVMTNEMPSHLDLMWIDPSYTEVFRRLASFARVVMFDRAGMGLSDPVDTVPTLEDLADHVEAVMEAAGIPSATLLGVGTANPGFALLAARAPARVERLVLWGGYAVGYRAPAGRQVYEQLGASYDRVATAWFDDVIPNWGRGHSLRFWAPGLDNDRARRGFAMLERASAGPKMVRAVTQAGWEADLRAVLPLIQAPTLVMANRDGAQALEMARYAASLIPGAQFEELPASTEVAGFGDYFAAALDQVERLMTGHRSAERHDRVLATVLFTDVVGSTELATRLDDERWSILLKRHEALLRDHVEAAGGRLVDLTGDGSLSVFDGPARGIRCAHAFTQAVRALDIEVRAGLHTGECEKVGQDLVGLAVHIGARVSAKAGAGEVWVSRTVRDLVAGSGLKFQPRGPHELKGVEGSWELFSLAGSDVGPIAVTPDTSQTNVTDRAVLIAARRAPSLMRILGRKRNGGPDSRSR